MPRISQGHVEAGLRKSRKGSTLDEVISSDTPDRTGSVKVRNMHRETNRQHSLLSQALERCFGDWIWA
jgi:hypothetical protein